MKIRSGYVSNSSSSSFCVVGRQIDNPDTHIELGRKVMVIVEAGGTSGENEDWSMLLNKEAYNILNKSRWFNSNKDYSCVRFILCNTDARMEYDDNLHEDVLICAHDVEDSVYVFDRDYSSPDTNEELINFLEEVD